MKGCIVKTNWSYQVPKVRCLQFAQCCVHIQLKHHAKNVSETNHLSNSMHVIAKRFAEIMYAIGRSTSLKKIKVVTVILCHIALQTYYCSIKVEIKRNHIYNK